MRTRLRHPQNSRAASDLAEVQYLARGPPESSERYPWSTRLLEVALDAGSITGGAYLVIGRCSNDRRAPYSAARTGDTSSFEDLSGYSGITPGAVADTALLAELLGELHEVRLQSLDVVTAG